MICKANFWIVSHCRILFRLIKFLNMCILSIIDETKSLNLRIWYQYGDDKYSYQAGLFASIKITDFLTPIYVTEDVSYIILVEPFTGKDMFTRQDFLKTIAGAQTGDENILLCTHELNEIANFIDRALMLNNGTIATDLLMDDLYRPQKNSAGIDKNSHRLPGGQI